MICRFFNTKLKSIILVVALSLCLCFVLKIAIKYRVQLVQLAPEGTVVSEEQLNEDISTILSLYGLKKSKSDLVIETTYSYSKNHSQEEKIKKRMFIHATPILWGSSKNYTEVETYMEIWLYVMEHNFDCEIDEIVYYFTAHSLDSILAPLTPNELYMTKEDFMSFYDELDIGEVSHSEKVKTLADAYVEKTTYKRKPGHVQVD